ncbi:tetratricopeptide repeat protein [Pseudoteredinibacter isoporae]|uniref:Tetratricopeptide (TPR) repeat protein n=1 Tax=Pseudoteredinibacter isoporae TaxID=570281 RepID=A0A7X0JV70_9GAMM|nr:tetratricopeptide repeat protein [Pseudoteredinibacter isoporae]MBB6521981.1 tetratricopeptide (TPR) repeat protein [Pseudoteredinibacter isoporae]NHO87517.1 tetratricopeptide repeat protein [Pseudoteredinibacter isoporae]NIB24152.1 tetratricopeptide repeat protein [Pseudoteredinibacter isoporae]
MSLDSNIAHQIEELCDRGYQLYDEQSYEAALRVFYQAWLKLPKPQAQYQQAAWVLTAIGDSYYKLSNYSQSIEALNSALHCPGGQLAFIHTRLAQAYYESGDKNSSAEHFQKAEEMDPKQTQKLAPKYRLFIKNNRLKR